MEIKMAVYDTDGKLYGYKTDTFWSLHDVYYKAHDVGSELRLIRNFIYMINEQKKKIDNDFLLLIDTIANTQKVALSTLLKQSTIIIKAIDINTNAIASVTTLTKIEGVWSISNTTAIEIEGV